MSDLLHLLFDLTFGTLGRIFRAGPVELVPDPNGERLRWSATNRGRRAMAFGALETRDGDGKRHYPEVDLPPRSRLVPEQPVTLTLSAPLPEGQPLVLIDTSGKRWPAG